MISNEQVDLFNKDVRAWTAVTRNKLKNNIRMLSNKGKGELLRHLSYRLYKDWGMVNRISYKFPRHGVFLQKGVGRGYKMKNGQIIKVNSRDPRIRRHPKDWFNSTIEERMPHLADAVGRNMANSAINATNIKIN